MSYFGNNIDTWGPINHTINEIYATYGHRVSVVEKAKSLLKFGENENVGTTFASLMTFPSDSIYQENYVTGNSIGYVSSAAVGDTMPITYEYHTLGVTGLVFGTTTVVLQGQTPVALPVNAYRTSRAFNATTEGQKLTGPVYFYEGDTVSGGVPQTNSKVHLMIPSGKQQSEKASTSVSYRDYLIITTLNASVLEKNTNIIADVDIQIRRFGNVFRQINDISVVAGQPSILPLEPFIIVPPNADVRMVALSNLAGTAISGGMDAYLATVI